MATRTVRSAQPQPLAEASTHAAAARATPFAPALLAWHAHHGRHDLPWQRERTPYRVWVSEIMLQQTQVATVVPYYQRFMQRLPTLAALAAAPLDEVLHLWSGLGYYARARHLHQAAQQVMREHAGELPGEPQSLQRLPGIGRSTAAAIVALAHGRRAVILDGNVKRVLSRLFAVAGSPGARDTEQRLWQLAEECTPEAEAASYTQAIMDLGATVCTRGRPHCGACPLRDGCIAHRTDRVLELPAVRRRANRPLRHTLLLLAIRSDGAVLLQRRPSHGVWAGLWSPPEFDSPEAAASFCQLRLRGARLDPRPQAPLLHRFTHFDLQIVPLRAECSAAALEVADGDDALWFRSWAPTAIGVPAPITTLLQSLTPPR